MNPYLTFSDLLFTCVDASPAEVVNTMLAGFNEPVESDVERALKTGSKEVEVIENGLSRIYRAGDPLPPKDTSIRYFAKEVPLDFALAYINHAEKDMSTLQRVVFWEPRIHPGKTAFMGAFHDGLSHSVWCLSLDGPFCWINVRIYDDIEYPACFFDYYAARRSILRRLMTCKDEEGWDFAQQGPIQPFEKPDYYTRRLKKDRLNREIITEYMEKLGYMIAQDGFWETDKPAYFLWQQRPGEISRTDTRESCTRPVSPPSKAW
jgi:hypothetical protein